MQQQGPSALTQADGILQRHRGELHLPTAGVCSEACLEVCCYRSAGPRMNDETSRRLHTDPRLDIDDKNLGFAKQNIVANGLKSRIRPLKTDPKDPLIPLDVLGLERYALLH